MPSPVLFRKAALARLTSPERLDELVRVVPLRTALAVGAVTVAVGAALGWSVLDRIPLRETIGGALVAPGAIRPVASQAAGVVTSVAVRFGDRVAAGSTLLRLRVAGGRAVIVRSGTIASVIDIEVAVGDTVSAGDTVVRLARPVGLEQLTAVAFATPSVAPTLRPGQHVRIAVAGVAPAAFGYLRGLVTRVGTLPVDPSDVVADVGVASLAHDLIARARGAPVEVDVALRRARTPSGFLWTKGQGPPFPVPFGTLATFAVRTGSQRPIDFLLPG